jgi:hypothetical protein
MDKRKKLQQVGEETKHTSKLMIAAVIVAIAVFVFGLLLGNYIVSSRISAFQQSEQKLLIHLIGLDIRDQVLENNTCNLNWDDIWKEKVELGKMLSSLENRLGKQDKEVLLRKEIYELIEIKTLFLIQDIKDNCHEDFDIVLFFYTNQNNDPKGSAGGSEDQGLILDQVVFSHNEQGNGKKVNVFAFDVNSENPATRALISKYNVEKVPTLVVNGKKYDYLVQADLEKLL